jgi:hypothetical protein
MNFVDEKRIYYYPAKKLKITFKLNTKDPDKGKMPLDIRIKKICLPPAGNKLFIGYEYTNIDSKLGFEYEVTVPIRPAYDGFCITGGPIMDLGGQLTPPDWKWWKAFATEDSMPPWIELTPVHGAKEFKRKSEMLGSWKKAWGRHLVGIWGSTYPNMVEKTTWAPAFSTSFKASQEKKASCFLFTRFVKDKAAVNNTEGFEANSAFKLRLKF